MTELIARVLEELRNAWRFRWYALLVAWILAVCGWLFVYSLPNEYQVDARVHIDTRSAIQPLMRGLTVLPDTSRQVDLLIQTILSRPNLKDIARRTGLDIKASTPEAEEELLDKLGARIKVRNKGYNIDLFQISFVGSNAETARAVVQQVINIMTTMALGDESGDSARAMDFLNKTVDESKDKLDKIERQMATFRKDHADVMPGRDDYVVRLQSLQGELERLNERLTAAQQRRSVLTKQAGSGGGTRVVPAEQSQQVKAIDAQIAQRRKNLQQMLIRYTDEYPDVVTLRRDIDQLEQQRAKTVAELRAHPERVAVNAGGAGAAAERLNEAEVQINTLKSSIERQQGRIDKLKGGASQMTDAQAKYQQMARDRNATKDQYEHLLSRLYSARLSQQVEKTGDRVKFDVIDPPEAPAEPTGPKRKLMMTLALFAGLAGGAVFAFFLSQIRPVFINRRSLTDITGLPVLGAVSMAASMQQNMRRQTALAVFVFGVGTLLLGYLGAVALTPIGTRLVPTFLSNQWL